MGASLDPPFSPPYQLRISGFFILFIYFFGAGLC